MRAILLGFVLSCLPQAWGGGIYWTDRGSGRVYHSSFSGQETQLLIDNAGSNVRGIAIDPDHGVLFYADNGADRIWKADLAGNHRVELAALSQFGNSFPADVEVDPLRRRVYWCDQARNEIRGMDYDGIETEALFPTISQPYFLFIDFPRRVFYWGDFSPGRIFSSPELSQNPVLLHEGINQVRDVAFVASEGRLFWVNRNGGKIQCLSLDDFIPRDLYSGLDTPHGMVVDAEAGTIYWADTGTNAGQGFGGQSIVRGTLDGTQPAEILLAGEEPWDLALDLRCFHYSEWVTRFFSKETPDHLTAPLSDPDQDGSSNFLEYFLGTSPRLSKRSEGGITWETPSDHQIRLSWTYRRSAQDIAWELQESRDLINWNSATRWREQLMEEVPEERTGSGLVRAHLMVTTETNQAQFWRLVAQPVEMQ